MILHRGIGLALMENTARDISWPIGTNQQLDAIEAHMRAMGASVIREPNAQVQLRGQALPFASKPDLGLG